MGAVKKPDEVADELAGKPVARVFPEAPVLVRKGLCPLCGKAIGDFKDELSEREYEISGLCQACQDGVFI